MGWTNELHKSNSLFKNCWLMINSVDRTNLHFSEPAVRNLSFANVVFGTIIWFENETSWGLSVLDIQSVDITGYYRMHGYYNSFSQPCCEMCHVSTNTSFTYIYTFSNYFFNFLCVLHKISEMSLYQKFCIEVPWFYF